MPLPSDPTRPRGLIGLADPGAAAPGSGGPDTPGALGTPPGPDAQDASRAPQGGQRLSPQQQRAYDLIVQQAMGFLLDQQRARHIVDKARAGNPRQAVVDAVAPLLQQIYTSARQAGAQVDMVTLLAAGITVIANLAEMLAVSGVIPEQDVPAFARDAAQLAVQQHNAGAPEAGADAGAGGTGEGAGVDRGRNTGLSADPMLQEA